MYPLNIEKQRLFVNIISFAIYKERKLSSLKNIISI